MIRQRARHLGPFDGWIAAFAVGLPTFSASLLIGTIVVLRTVQSGAVPAAASETDDVAAIEPAPTSAVQATVETMPDPAGAGVPDARLPETTPEAINESARAVTLVGDEALTAAISAALGDQQSHFGVVVKRLSDGKGAALNDDLVFYAASTFKLAVLYEAEKRISEGDLRLDDTLQLTEADVAEDLGDTRRAATE